MPLDINHFRVDKGKFAHFSMMSQIVDDVFFVGGNPDEVKRSQRARFADEGLVDKVIELDAIAKKGKQRDSVRI